jgi:hypothetical protein
VNGWDEHKRRVDAALLKAIHLDTSPIPAATSGLAGPPRFDGGVRGHHDFPAPRPETYREGGLGLGRYRCRRPVLRLDRTGPCAGRSRSRRFYRVRTSGQRRCCLFSTPASSLLGDGLKQTMSSPFLFTASKITAPSISRLQRRVTTTGKLAEHGRSGFTPDAVAGASAAVATAEKPMRTLRHVRVMVPPLQNPACLGRTLPALAASVKFQKRWEPLTPRIDRRSASPGEKRAPACLCGNGN